MNVNPNDIKSVEFTQKCDNISDSLNYFTKTLGFKLNMIFPADNPSVAVLEGFNIKIRLDRKGKSTSTIRVICSDKSELDFGSYQAPNGTIIELLSETDLSIPENIQSFAFSQMINNDDWITGRAGMEYRDLIPERQNGRFIASHIKIEQGGPVPDYTHFHNIRFQLIYCYKGWVKVAYEDQGDVITMKAGDCFLQPPLIRHQVLEASDGLEVIELACPAEHETFTDRTMILPTGKHFPDRDFNGQKFVYHNAETASWKNWRLEGFESMDTGINKATNGLLSVQTVRLKSDYQAIRLKHHEEFLFFFILSGIVNFEIENHGNFKFTTGDSFVVPENHYHQFQNCSDDLRFLEVRLSGDFKNISR